MCHEEARKHESTTFQFHSICDPSVRASSESRGLTNLHLAGPPLH
jgi:hypothetical protein